MQRQRDRTSSAPRRRDMTMKKILNTFGKNNTILMSHVSHKVKGVEFSTGSLGHGLPYAVGKALGGMFEVWNVN